MIPVTIISKNLQVRVEFNHEVILIGKSVQQCEAYYIEHYGSDYAITWLSVL